MLLDKCFIHDVKHKDDISLGSSPKDVKINSNKRNQTEFQYTVLASVEITAQMELGFCSDLSNPFLC